MAAEEAERTEPATPRRRDEARRKGSVAQSRELQSVVVLALAYLTLGSLVSALLAGRIARKAAAAWSGSQLLPDTPADFHLLLLDHFATAAAVVLPLLLIFAGGGGLAQLVQTGPLFSLEALAPRSERLDPFKGLKRLASLDRLVDLGKALFKFAVVLALIWGVLSSSLGAIVELSGAEVEEALAMAAALGRRTGGFVLGALAVMAVFDVGYTRWRYEKNLRMTRKEIRDEHKEHEGDPRMRGRYRSMHRELSRARMIAAVADADVVITNPTEYAVALRYQRVEMRAPTVVAKGRNHVARRMRVAADEHGVPIVADPPLARLLHRSTQVGREIPEVLFEAVAQVLAYVYRMDPRRARAWGTSP